MPPQNIMADIRNTVVSTKTVESIDVRQSEKAEQIVYEMHRDCHIKAVGRVEKKPEDHARKYKYETAAGIQMRNREKQRAEHK